MITNLYSIRSRSASLVMVMLLFSLFCHAQAIEKLGENQNSADKFFAAGSYRAALNIYQELMRKDHSADLVTKVARTYYKMRNYPDCTLWYAEASRSGSLSDEDTFNYAECLCASGNYRDAEGQFKQYVSNHKDDELAQNKIWRINNIKFLYEDSAYYGVTKLDLNTSYSEMNAVPFKDGVLFVSDRSSHSAVKNVSMATGNEFYKLYYSNVNVADANGHATRRIEKNLRSIQSRFHNGGFGLYNQQSKIVICRTADDPSTNGRYSMQLFFAERVGQEWAIQSRYVHNSTEYSLVDPWISENGNVLYFASDMKGGFGGLDIYKSELINGHWSRPVNLGEQINTRMDEKTPFMSESGVLYFSSDGHAGLGGFDIFRVDARDNGELEIFNMGFPVNTSFDDFAFRHDDQTSIGYLTSNRQGNDDIYQVVSDRQIYPLMISGVLKTKEESWKENDDLKFLPGASLFLIDHARNTVVGESKSDPSGNFSMNIPYFSLFKIRVVQPDGTEALVSLELPKQKKKDLHHDIVIVKDAFKSQGQ